MKESVCQIFLANDFSMHQLHRWVTILMIPSYWEIINNVRY